MKDPIKQFVKDRDEAMKAAVMQDDLDAVKRYSKKYCVPLPKNGKVMKAGVYKAMQEIMTMPDIVKRTAWEKCTTMGFRPTMR